MTKHMKLATASAESTTASEITAKSGRISYPSVWLANRYRHCQTLGHVLGIAAVGGLLFLAYVVWLHRQMSYGLRSREAQRTLLADAGITVTGSVSPFWKIGGLEVWPSNDLDSSITRLEAVGTDFDTPQGKQAIECISMMGRLQKLRLRDCVQIDRLLLTAIDNPIDYLIVDGVFSDQDLEILLGMHDLRAVRLYNTQATEQAVNAFHLKRPSLRIEVFSHSHEGDPGPRDMLILGPLANEVICRNSIDKLQLWYPPKSACAIDDNRPKQMMSFITSLGRGPSCTAAD